MRKIGNSLYWLLAVILFVIICLRAYLIPITHDESGQITYYAQFPIKDIFLFTNPWPTNHIFNSLLIKLSTAVLGISQISGRLPNIIFSLLSFLFAFKIARALSPTSFAFPLFSLCIFLLDPFLFDFFGLARGYGLAIGFELGAFYFLLLYLRSFRLTDLLALGLCLFLMVLSNFSWLIVFTSVVAFVGFIILLNRKYAHFIFALLILLLCAAVFYTPVMRMNETHQFVFWSSDGFYKDTVVSLWNDYKYGQPFSLLSTDAWIVLLYIPLIVALILAVRDLIKGRKIELDIPIILLVLTIVVNLAQHTLLGTPFLSTRTALLYVPLYGFSLVSLLARTQYTLPKLSFGIGLSISIFMCFHFFSWISFTSVREWWYDANTLEVLAVLRDVHEKEHTDIELNTMWIYNPSFSFYKQTDHLDWLTYVNTHKPEEAPHKCRFYYTDFNTINGADIKGYKECRKYGYDRLLLELETDSLKK